jgi:hypothetical protein
MEPPGPDVVAIDDRVWPWLAYLDQLLRRGQLWMVRAELHEILHRPVAPVLGATRGPHEADLSEHDRAALHEAAPTSGRPEELRRALHATVELYQRAVDRWVSQTGRQRRAPSHPPPRPRGDGEIVAFGEHGRSTGRTRGRRPAPAELRADAAPHAVTRPAEIARL